ncbi:MAG TPA: ATP-binding protein [Terriglobales bacterium]|jgi:PAS domain S-box-containing protein|nr:ATP-binding protein [Terriglobales bacterium]
MSTAVKKATDAAPPGSAQTLSLLDDRILAMIMGESPLPKILDALCADIENQHRGMLCSVLLLDADGLALRNGAAPSLPQEYSRAIDGVRVGPCAGSCGTALYRKQPVVVSDIASDPLWADYRELALRHGLRACWSNPIPAQDGTMLGTFAIYYRQPRVPEAEHLRLIAHATHLVAIAIERDRDKTELRAAEDRYRTLVERLPAITYVAELGADGPWHYVSPQIESILGFSPKEFLADPMNWMNHIHPEDREIALAAEKLFQETHELFRAEYRMIARDGRVLWFRDEGVMLQAELGVERLMMQGVLYDITEHKRLEEQLRHSQKLEAVGQLAGGVAHDFNNLLMVIQAHNERLRGRLAPSDAAFKDAAEIERAVVRATALTQQLLAFSRRQVLQLKIIDLNGVVTEVAKMLDRLIPANIELKVIPAALPNWIKADAGQIEQVILNLVVNARDAMPRGGLLAISTKNVELRATYAGSHTRIPPGKYVVLSVTDTGTGMHKDVQAKIFEPFFTTKKPGEGTGLGLAIVYGVVKQTGGWITTRSELGKGTTVDIYLPEAQKKPEPAVEKTSQVEISNALAAGEARGTETILLVEDQEGIRELVCEFLQNKGYTVLVAADGYQALQIADKCKEAIHLLLTDVAMPNVGGRELALRLTPSRPKMKVIFMSGYPDHSTWSSGLVDDFESAAVLQKPFLLDTLARKVRRILGEVS